MPKTVTGVREHCEEEGDSEKNGKRESDTS